MGKIESQKLEVRAGKIEIKKSNPIEKLQQIQLQLQLQKIRLPKDTTISLESAKEPLQSTSKAFTTSRSLQILPRPQRSRNPVSKTLTSADKLTSSHNEEIITLSDSDSSSASSHCKKAPKFKKLCIVGGKKASPKSKGTKFKQFHSHKEKTSTQESFKKPLQSTSSKISSTLTWVEQFLSSVHKKKSQVPKNEIKNTNEKIKNQQTEQEPNVKMRPQISQDPVIKTKNSSVKLSCRNSNQEIIAISDSDSSYDSSQFKVQDPNFSSNEKLDETMQNLRNTYSWSSQIAVKRVPKKNNPKPAPKYPLQQANWQEFSFSTPKRPSDNHKSKLNHERGNNNENKSPEFTEHGSSASVKSEEIFDQAKFQKWFKRMLRTPPNEKVVNLQQTDQSRKPMRAFSCREQLGLSNVRDGNKNENFTQKRDEKLGFSTDLRSESQSFSQNYFPEASSNEKIISDAIDNSSSPKTKNCSKWNYPTLLNSEESNLNYNRKKKVMNLEERDQSRKPMRALSCQEQLGQNNIWDDNKNANLTQKRDEKLGFGTGLTNCESQSFSQNYFPETSSNDATDNSSSPKTKKCSLLKSEESTTLNYKEKSYRLLHSTSSIHAFASIEEKLALRYNRMRKSQSAGTENSNKGEFVASGSRLLTQGSGYAAYSQENNNILESEGSPILSHRRRIDKDSDIMASQRSHLESENDRESPILSRRYKRSRENERNSLQPMKGSQNSTISNVHPTSDHILKNTHLVGSSNQMDEPLFKVPRNTIKKAAKKDVGFNVSQRPVATNVSLQNRSESLANQSQSCCPSALSDHSYNLRQLPERLADQSFNCPSVLTEHSYNLRQLPERLADQSFNCPSVVVEHSYNLRPNKRTVPSNTKIQEFNIFDEAFTAELVESNIDKIGSAFWLEDMLFTTRNLETVKKPPLVDIEMDFSKIVNKNAPKSAVKRYRQGDTTIFRPDNFKTKKTRRELEGEELFEQLTQGSHNTDNLYIEEVISPLPVPEDCNSSDGGVSVDSNLTCDIKTQICKNHSQEIIQNELKALIREVVLKVWKAFRDGKIPRFMVRQRKLEFCEMQNDRLTLKKSAKWSKVSFNSKSSRTKFCLILYILGKTYGLIEKDVKLTKREVYYQIKHLIRNQSQIDAAISEVCCILNVGQWHLNIYGNRGLVYGDLKIVFKMKETLDCGVPGGTLIPFNTEDIIEAKSPAKFILVVEKESIFRKLISEEIMNKLYRPFIMITGKGVPDFGTQLFLKKISKLMMLPVYILVDADPAGVKIMMNYRFGAARSSYLTQHLAVPQARWVGVFPSDIDRHLIRNQPLTEREKKGAKTLLGNPCLNTHQDIKSQIEILLQTNRKAAIEGLIKSDASLTTYLKNKFRSKTYL